MGVTLDGLERMGSPADETPSGFAVKVQEDAAGKSYSEIGKPESRRWDGP